MIIDKIGYPAAFEQLAEEAAELAQAALKYARKLRGENPTPKTLEEIKANLIEEYTDVELCAILLRLSADQNIMNSKMNRWEERLKNDKD